MNDYYDEGCYQEEYDPRTYTQKVHDDNTWQKNRGVLEFDGRPHLMWCPDCNKVVKVESIEGSNVFDRYSYTICHECGCHDNNGLRELTEEDI